MSADPQWRAGDTGTTDNGWPYRVLCHDLKGAVGTLVVAYTPSSGVERLAQYPADGRHPVLGYLDLKPPKVRA